MRDDSNLSERACLLKYIVSKVKLTLIASVRKRYNVPYHLKKWEIINTSTTHFILICSPGNVKCQWKTVAGTAKSPEDYTGSTGAVEFAPGSRSSTINITIIDDNAAELSKTFRVELFIPEGGGK